MPDYATASKYRLRSRYGIRSIRKILTFVDNQKYGRNAEEPTNTSFQRFYLINFFHNRVNETIPLVGN